MLFCKLPSKGVKFSGVLIPFSTVQLAATAALSSVSFWSDGYRYWIQHNTWMIYTSVSNPFRCVLL